MKKERGNTYFRLDAASGSDAVMIIVGSEPKNIPYINICEIDGDDEVGINLYYFRDADLKRLYRALAKHLGIK